MTDAGETSFEWAMQLLREAAIETLGNEATWIEERERPSRGPIAWPLPKPRNEAQRLGTFFMEATVDHIVGAMLASKNDDQAARLLFPDGDLDAASQLILRMASRVVEKAIAEGQRQMGAGRLSGVREWKKRMREHLAEQAILVGGDREAAFKAFGLSKASAYRAVHRSRAK